MDSVFEYDEDTEYPLPEFFTKFKDKLPQLVVVTGGDYGMTKWDDLSNDTIIRYHRCYGLQRVVARPSNEANRQRLEYITVPVEADYHYHVITSRTHASQQKTMAEILREHQLPVLVRFAGRTIPTIPDIPISSAFLVLRVYEQHFLQGNCIIDGEMMKLPVSTILSPNISVSLITGLKSGTKEQFSEYTKQLQDYVTKHVKFSFKDCDLSIKKFRYDEKGYEGLIDEKDILSQVDDGKPAPQLPPRRGQSQKSQQSKVTDDNRDDNEDDEESDEGDNYEVVEEPLEPSTPKGQRFDSKERPPLPPPRPTEQAQGKDANHTAITAQKPDYENDIVCQVKPVPKESDIYYESTGCVDSNKTTDQTTTTAQQPTMTGDKPAKLTNQPTKFTQQSSKSEEAKEDKYLSIEEIGSVLCQLHLEKHIETFANEKVDSVILKDFDENILKEEFGFTRLETIRLMKYIHTGHIPH